MGLRPPELPLTNNEAERALRHGVIARQISHGARTATGARIFLQIAAIARAQGRVVVTHNTPEFARVPSLVLEDWLV